MGWFELGRDLGLFTIASWIIQNIITKSSNRDLEKYKRELDYTFSTHQLVLDNDLNKYKSKLDLHLSKQNSLHQTRLEIVKDLYQKVVHLDSHMRLMTTPYVIYEGQDSDAIRKERDENAQKALMEYTNYYLLNKLYLDKETTNLLEKIRLEYRTAQYDFYELVRSRQIMGARLSPEAQKNAYEKVTSASKKIQEDIPKTLEVLEQKFRVLLGVIENEFS